MGEGNESDSPREENSPFDWVDQHGDALFAYTLMRIRDRSSAEDIVQETFLAALTARERFAGDSTVRTWLIGILRRKIVDYLRVQQREAPVSEQELAARFAPEQYRKEPLQKWADDPAKILEEKEFWKIFHDCTEKLPEKLADAYYLREIGDLQSDEICKVLEITPTNLALRVFRARAFLRYCLDKNWFSKESGNR